MQIVNTCSQAFGRPACPGSRRHARSGFSTEPILGHCEARMTKFPVQGGCHCGAVRYTLRGPALSVQHCHFSRCRKVHGQLSASGAVVHRADMQISGAANLTTYSSSVSFHFQFCKTCGCPLFSTEDSLRDIMYFSPATLDGGVHPGHPAEKESHTYVGSKAEWDCLGENLARFERESPDEIMTAIQRK